MAEDNREGAAERLELDWRDRAGRLIPTKDELRWAELLLDEFKYRHDRYWRILELFGGFALLIAITPWVKTDLVDALGRYVFFFPTLSFFVALAAGLLLIAEGQRMRAEEDLRLAVRKRLGCVAFRLKSPYAEPLWSTRIGRIDIGSAVSIMLLLFFLVGNGVNGWLLNLRLSQSDAQKVASPEVVNAVPIAGGTAGESN